MKVVAFWALTITIALPKLLFATLFSVSELGGEVATFKGPNIGSDVLVRLWIVDQRDSTWIEHGVRPSINQSYWITKLSEPSMVTLIRKGKPLELLGFN